MEFIQKQFQKDERLDWDRYFMCIAFLAAQRSPCSRLQVGSVIVRQNRLVSMGYNGFLPGCAHRSVVRDGHEQAIVHSEMNAITDCARRGVSADGSTIYITHYPCLNCFRAIVACGIREIVFAEEYRNDPLVESLGKEACISLRRLI